MKQSNIVGWSMSQNHKNYVQRTTTHVIYLLINVENMLIHLYILLSKSCRWNKLLLMLQMVCALNLSSISTLWYFFYLAIWILSKENDRMCKNIFNIKNTKKIKAMFLQDLKIWKRNKQGCHLNASFFQKTMPHVFGFWSLHTSIPLAFQELVSI